MKTQLTKSLAIKTLLICLFTFCMNSSYGQKKIKISKDAITMNSNISDFHKNYLKVINDQLKINTELLNLIEKEIRKTTFQKKFTKQLKDKMKLAKVTLSSVKKDINTIEKSHPSMGDDAQLANIDLQNSLQKQQQTLQTITNVSKMLHDTAMAIIRKIG